MHLENKFFHYLCPRLVCVLPSGNAHEKGTGVKIPDSTRCCKSRL